MTQSTLTPEQEHEINEALCELVGDRCTYRDYDSGFLEREVEGYSHVRTKFTDSLDSMALAEAKLRNLARESEDNSQVQQYEQTVEKLMIIAAYGTTPMAFTPSLAPFGWLAVPAHIRAQALYEVLKSADSKYFDRCE